MKPFLLCLLLSATQASAGLITLNATSSGFYLDSGTHVSGGYFVGWSTGQPPGEVRNFFVFDLSTVTGTITGATLRLSSIGTSGSIGYLGSNPTETYSVFDVSTPLTNLTNGTGGVAAFNDLGSGTSFGSVEAIRPVGPNVEPAFREVILNSAALSFLQSNLGPNSIAVGGSITTLARGNFSEGLFNGTNATLTRQLIITTEDSAANSVPEPSTMLLAGLALITLTAAKRK